MQARTGHVALPAAGVIDIGLKLLQIAVVGATAAAGRPCGMHYTSVSAPVPAHPSPQQRSAPLGRRVSGDGMLRADCT